MVSTSGRGARAVFAAFQWFAYDRESGRPDAWGPALRNVRGSEHAWRAHTGLSRSLWPGGPTQGKEWRGCRTRPWTPTGGVPAQLWSARPRHPHLSLPFPLAKGPCVVMASAVAAELADGDHSRRERVHAMHVVNRLANQTAKSHGSNKVQFFARILHDIFLSYVLGSARRGRGLANITLVDIGVGPTRGYVEARSMALPLLDGPRAMKQTISSLQHASSNVSVNATESFAWVRGLTPRFRVGHFGRKFVKLTAQRRWPAEQWRAKSTEVLREGFDVLHARVTNELKARAAPSQQPQRGRHVPVASGGGGDGSRRTLRCVPTDWWSNSRCLVATGADWHVCTLVDVRGE